MVRKWDKKGKKNSHRSVPLKPENDLFFLLSPQVHVKIATRITDIETIKWGWRAGFCPCPTHEFTLSVQQCWELP
jgi:hypothetical protein